MNILCMKCKKDTDNTDEQEGTMKGKGNTVRRVMRCKCKVCGTNKFRILPNK